MSVPPTNGGGAHSSPDLMLISQTSHAMLGPLRLGRTPYASPPMDRGPRRGPRPAGGVSRHRAPAGRPVIQFFIQFFLLFNSVGAFFPDYCCVRPQRQKHYTHTNNISNFTRLSQIHLANACCNAGPPNAAMLPVPILHPYITPTDAFKITHATIKGASESANSILGHSTISLLCILGARNSS